MTISVIILVIPVMGYGIFKLRKGIPD